ncbi:MAG: hypothetical protein M1828_004770 [Chrysothrix sp. TS-e1954]|nr:MAG: hypothetical protein M1828_004770 [Chrysothrix sp. TS-e1954]
MDGEYTILMLEKRTIHTISVDLAKHGGELQDVAGAYSVLYSEWMAKILNLQILSLTTSDASTPLLAADRSLLITGLLQLSKLGSASAALYNGTALTPFILSTLSDGSPGKIYRAFVSRPQSLLTASSSSRLALG